MGRNLETWCGVGLFNWENWDEWDTGVLFFYDVIWELDSMKKYNNCDLSINMNGSLNIYGGDEEIWSGYIIEIAEVKERLLGVIHREVIDYANGITMFGTKENLEGARALIKELERRFK